MDLAEKISESAFFSVGWRERERKKCQKIVQVGDAVDQEDDVYSLLSVVVLSVASVTSNSPPPDTWCGACDSDENKTPQFRTNF